jgi:hexosaminidase
VVPATAVIPKPLKLVERAGAFTFTPETRIAASAELAAPAEILRDQLRPATGLPLAVVRSARGSHVAFALDPKLANLGDEGYRIEVTEDEIAIRAPKLAGVRHGAQTLRQLLPTAIFRRAPVNGVRWTVPAVEIEDRPRFGWRGSHLDVGRHFMPKEFILKHLDLLAIHKLNVFHWHLTEDQGWRIEIKRYPKLTAVGAWRKDTMTVPRTRDPEKRRFTGKPHAGLYTQDDVREVVRYAADRGITVMPEIEMPGHAVAAIAAYPELGNTGEPLEVLTYWGVHDHVLGVGDNVLRFFENVLEEVLELFPSRFVHVGGDEVPKTEWKASAEAQARMKAEGLKDEDELQSWFIRHFDEWLAKRGRRLVGWDEILEGGLAPGATVMSWRGEEGGVAAARAGHDVVMTPQKPTYFDHDQSKEPGEPEGIGGHNSLEDVYAYEPVPKELDDGEGKRVLGSQGQIWTEYMPDSKRVEYNAWPRLAALAEVLWSPREGRDYAEFRTRLETHLERLRIVDVNFRPLGPDQSRPWPPPV